MNYVPNAVPNPEAPADDNGDTAIHVPYDHMVQAEVQVTSTDENTDGGSQFQTCAILWYYWLKVDVFCCKSVSKCVYMGLYTNTYLPL